MNKRYPKIVAGLVLALMLVGILGATIAYAQDGTTPIPTADDKADGRGPGHGRGFFGITGLRAAADTLDMTIDELVTELENGKTLQDLADEAGVDLQVVKDAIHVAHAEELRQRIEQAVSDGTMTQEKADWLLEGLDKGFLDGPGFGFGFRHRPGGPPPADATLPTPNP